LKLAAAGYRRQPPSFTTYRVPCTAGRKSVAPATSSNGTPHWRRAEANDPRAPDDQSRDGTDTLPVTRE